MNENESSDSEESIPNEVTERFENQSSPMKIDRQTSSKELVPE